MKSPFSLSSSGMSLIEVLVTMGVLSISMYAMMMFVSVQQKENKALLEGLGRVELQRTLLLALSDGSVCTAELANPSLYTAGAKPATIDETNLSSNEISLTKLHSSAVATAPTLIEQGQFINVGMSGSLKIFSIKVKNFTTIGLPEKYFADLEVAFEPSSLVRPLKSLMLKTVIVTSGGPPTAKNITSCKLTEKLDAKRTCTDLGGQWLEATSGNRFMPIPRCNMTDDIFLNASENPDDIPMNGTANAEGTAITECYYGSTQNTTYRCVSRVGSSFTADVCAYDEDSKQWEVIRYVKGAPTKTIRRICTRGVLASKKSSGYTILNFNEPLEEAIPSLSTASWHKKTSYLQTVTQCRANPRAEVWSTCANPTNPEAALRGEKKACIYVENGKLNLPNKTYITYFKQYNADNDPDLVSSNYTGWIYVTVPRVIKLTAGNIAIKEAQGIPCYAVEVNKENDPADFSFDPPNSKSKPESLLGIPTEASRIKSCFVDGTIQFSGDNPGTRHTLLPCDQSSVKDPMPITSTDIEEFRDQFPKNSCWHFYASPVKDYSPHANVTGWFAITGSLPAGMLMIISSSHPYKKSLISNAIKVVPGIPCNAGVEYE